MLISPSGTNEYKIATLVYNYQQDVYLQQISSNDIEKTIAHCTSIVVDEQWCFFCPLDYAKNGLR